MMNPLDGACIVELAEVAIARDFLHLAKPMPATTIYLREIVRFNHVRVERAVTNPVTLLTTSPASAVLYHFDKATTVNTRD